MKSITARLDDCVTLDKFIAAHKRASKSKGLRAEVLRFNVNMIGNLLKIMDIIKNEQYQPSDYRCFMVHDPKDRLILALPYADRIVHQWYIEEFIKPYYLPRFIPDSFACIPDRGSHRAVARAQEYMRKISKENNGRYYILKMDISKFFNSIDPHVLYDILAKRMRDKKLRDLTYIIIFDGDNHPGLPIGNYVSQYFANIYLNELDQFCKNKLGIKYYVRYMDDFVAFSPDRATARLWYNEIDQFVQTYLKMKLNRKSRYYPGGNGLDFVGYVIYENFKLIRKRSKKKLQSILRYYRSGQNDKAKFAERATAWYGHAQHADTWRYTKSRLGQYADILPVIKPLHDDSQ